MTIASVTHILQRPAQQRAQQSSQQHSQQDSQQDSQRISPSFLPRIARVMIPARRALVGRCGNHL